MVRKNIPLKSRYLLFREEFKTATDLDSLVITTVGTKKATRHEHFYGCNPNWMKFLRTWGEDGTIKVKLIQCLRSQIGAYCACSSDMLTITTETCAACGVRIRSAHTLRDMSFG
jgi:hypothetical protein